MCYRSSKIRSLSMITIAALLISLAAAQSQAILADRVHTGTALEKKHNVLADTTTTAPSATETASVPQIQPQVTVPVLPWPLHNFSYPTIDLCRCYNQAGCDCPLAKDVVANTMKVASHSRYTQTSPDSQGDHVVSNAASSIPTLSSSSINTPPRPTDIIRVFTTDAQGEPVAIKAHVNTTLYSNFISSEFAALLGLPRTSEPVTGQAQDTEYTLPAFLPEFDPSSLFGFPTQELGSTSMMFSAGVHDQIFSDVVLRVLDSSESFPLGVVLGTKTLNDMHALSLSQEFIVLEATESKARRDVGHDEL